MIDSLSPANPEVEFTTSIMTLMLNIRYIRHHIKRVYDQEGNVLGYISSHQDITDDALYANSLKKQIFKKNEIIKDKDVQIKEAHHNIKNSLNILLSLIRMEEHSHMPLKEIVEDTLSHYDVDYCYLFGSYAKGKAKEDSDVDLLVATDITGMDFFGLAEDLRENLHKKVDLLNLDQLGKNRELLNEILKDGVRIYGNNQR